MWPPRHGVATRRGIHLPQGELPSVFEPVLLSSYEVDDLLRMAAESPQVSICRGEARYFQEDLERSLHDLGV